MHNKNVALVDDHTLIRAGIKGIIENFDSYKVIEEGESGQDALRIVQNTEPDLLILDVSLSDISGIEALKKIRRQYPHLPVLMMSLQDSPENLFQALKCGATGYILKDSSEREFRLALDYAREHKPFLSPDVARHLIELVLNTAPEPHEEDALTKRQQEVVELIAEGRSTRQIAEELGLSVKTVESHRSQIMLRLNLNSAAELVHYAITRTLN